MDLTAASLQFNKLYLQIFVACYMRHVRDPQSEQIISTHQARILGFLDDQKPTSLTELAHYLGVTLSTMSLSVDRLERLALVRRDRDPADGRKLQLTLTEEGVRMKATRALLEPTRIRKVLARLDAEGRGEVIRGLELLAAAAQQEMNNEPPGLR